MISVSTLFSCRKTREGFNDSKGRGRICYRLIQHIQHALPKVFILENVKGSKDANEGAAIAMTRHSML